MRAYLFTINFEISEANLSQKTTQTHQVVTVPAVTDIIDLDSLEYLNDLFSSPIT